MRYIVFNDNLHNRSAFQTIATTNQYKMNKEYSLPFKPANPGNPSSPDNPGIPSVPRSPLRPFSPGRPSSPEGPRSPFRPEVVSVWFLWSFISTSLFYQFKVISQEKFFLNHWLSDSMFIPNYYKIKIRYKTLKSLGYNKMVIQ